MKKAIISPAFRNIKNNIRDHLNIPWNWYQFQGLLRWSLILFFMFLKAGLIMAFFMHLFWERYALVNILLWPMTAIACFVGLMVAEGKYTVFTRLLYFFTGG